MGWLKRFLGLENNPDVVASNPGWSTAHAGPARIPSKPDGNRKRAIIGLDFGTSSTKAVVQILNASRANQIYIIGHERAASEPEIICPSTVAYDDNNLYFGWTAESLGAKRKFRSFKMCLACLHGQQRAMGKCPTCNGSQPGHFVVGGKMLTAEELSTFYLAFVLKSVAAQAGLKSTDEVFVNTAAPLDQMKTNPALRSSFERVIEQAFQLWPKAFNPWPIRDADLALQDIKRATLLPLEERRTAVFPETLAAMAAFLKMPGRPKGNYASVDIGAGTTDVAFFWFHKTDGDLEACYYSAATYPVGMDDIDMALSQVIPPSEMSPRQAREELQTESLVKHAELFRKVTDAMYDHYRRTWGQAYENCPGESRWVRQIERPLAEESSGHHKLKTETRRIALFELCLVGGGAKFGPIIQKMVEPLAALRMDETPYELPSVPGRIQMLLSGRVADVPERCNRHRSLLLLAYGLAAHAIDIPRYDPNTTFFPVKRVQLAVSNPSLENEDSSYTFS